MGAEPEWMKHEREVQDLLGLVGMPGSGNQWNAPSDGVTPGHYSESTFPLMVDCKSTKQKSYSLRRDVLAQWVEKADLAGKEFAMPIRFHDGPSRTPTSEDYIVVPLHHYAELRAKAEGQA